MVRARYDQERGRAEELLCHDAVNVLRSHITLTPWCHRGGKDRAAVAMDRNDLYHSRSERVEARGVQVEVDHVLQAGRWRARSRTKRARGMQPAKSTTPPQRDGYRASGAVFQVGAHDDEAATTTGTSRTSRTSSTSARHPFGTY